MQNAKFKITIQNSKLEERTIEISGIKTFMRIKGKGEPFLILHGWGASSDSWKEVQEILAENFEVIVLDLPGFGKSDLPPKIWDLNSYAEFVLDLIKRLGIEKFYLLGHSFGGAIAIKITLFAPEKIKKLILVDAAGRRQKKRVFKKILKTSASFLRIFSIVPGYEFFRKCFYRFVLRKTDYLEAVGIMKEVFKKVVSEDLMDSWPKIKVPTLIIWGKEDKITPKKDALKMKELIKNSEIILIEDASHAPNLSHPQKLAEIIKEKV